ncbi:high light inducible protein [Gracilaria domingensis]|nr:high light inducible protein [Gracilaria domingensis]
MSSQPAFTAPSTIPFNRFRPVQTCRNRSLSRIAIRRLRATAADPERPKNVPASDPPPSEPVAPPEPITPPEAEFEEEVPGKIQLDEITLAKQRRVLEDYSKQLREKRLEEEREASRLFGFVPYAETLNGRLAMFFIVTGLLTEYWTGYTLPEQVELMLRTLGIL